MVYCTACPRSCKGVRTLSAGDGFCGMGLNPVVARAALHYWEEPCISGEEGSGTVFFSGCSLKCVYCQNYSISSEGFGKEITVERLADIYKELEEKGANNINLVNPTHFLSAVCKSLEIYKPGIPVVYNTSGYEKKESLARLEGMVDIYLTDLKYYDAEISAKYSDAKDYFAYASEAAKEMRRQIPQDLFDGRGIMQKGLIIRHLVLPRNLTQTYKVLEWISRNFGKDIIVSLMSQYTPFGKADAYPEINRRLTHREYDKVCAMLADFGLDNGYIQDLSSSGEAYIPPFNLEGV